MKKQELRKLRTLNATRAMMDKAMKDTPRTVRRYSWAHTEYKYGIYLRCQNLKGYLKIACFLVGRMKTGNNKPAYEIFIDPENGEFITWDCINEKWSNAKIDNLDWPQYTWHSGHYINSCGYQNIKHILGTSKGGYAGILEYQNNIRLEELKRSYRRETEPWDLDMEQIPDVPKDWERWVNKTAIQQNYIFYQYKKGGTKEGWCTYCEKWVPIKNPRYNVEGICSKCKKKITYKSFGKAGRFNTDYQYIYLLQKCEDGFVLRIFNAHRHYQTDMYGIPGTVYDRNVEVNIYEMYRIIYTSPFAIPKVYYWEEYRDGTIRWCRHSLNKSYYNPNDYWKGMVYKRTLPSLKKQLERTGLIEYIYGLKKCDPLEYLKALNRKPILEQLVKAGLTTLADEKIRRDRFNYDKENGGKLTKILEIDSFRLKRLRKLNGGKVMLQWFRYEKENNTQYPDNCLKYFDQNRIRPQDIGFILDRMTIVKVYNYLARQEKIFHKKNIGAILRVWEDYLKMAKRLKMDVYNELFYKPKNIQEAHNRVIQLMEENGLSIKAGEIADKYPEVENILAELKEKYSFSGKKFSIVIPEKIEDILNESNALSLCMDRDDRYYERIQIRETYIAFLRRTAEPEKPWYVIEFEPNGTLRQESTVGDNKNKDFDEAIPFIKKWQRELSKRITAEDRKLAEESVKRRQQEWEELKKNKNRIWRGPLQGRLLHEVLEERLMEVDKDAV